jgi:hypothetical protein
MRVSSSKPNKGFSIKFAMRPKLKVFRKISVWCILIQWNPKQKDEDLNKS